MSRIAEESSLMYLLRMLGFHRLAWSARRLHCPVPSNALVLDVGSGGNPYPRANVLLDAYEDTPERFHLPLIKDRPMVLGSAEKMPFRNKAFDFVIASHVLEHTSEPEKFISELTRVAKAGYIETPDGFFERINPFRFHRLEVNLVADTLMIYKKPSWRHDAYLVDLYENQLKCKEFIAFTSSFPWPFYMRFYWEQSIKFKVTNPDVDASWELPRAEYAKAQIGIRYSLVSLIRRLFSQRRRNANISLFELLACPSCSSENLSANDALLSCKNCGQTYTIHNGIPVMYPDTKYNRLV